MQERELTARPVLARGVRLRRDRVRGASMLVGPERGLLLSDTAAAIVELCDGTRDAAGIARALRARYAADPATVEADVAELLRALTRRWFVAWKDPGS